MKKTFVWLTEQKDMEIATSIVEQHKNIPEDKTLALFEISIMPSRVSDKKGTFLSLKMSSWLKELLNAYNDMYGHEHGMAIFLQASIRICLNGETIH